MIHRCKCYVFYCELSLIESAVGTPLRLARLGRPQRIFNVTCFAFVNQNDNYYF